MDKANEMIQYYSQFLPEDYFDEEGDLNEEEEEEEEEDDDDSHNKSQKNNQGGALSISG